MSSFLPNFLFFLSFYLLYNYKYEYINFKLAKLTVIIIFYAYLKIFQF